MGKQESKQKRLAEKAKKWIYSLLIPSGVVAVVLTFVLSKHCSNTPPVAKTHIRPIEGSAPLEVLLDGNSSFDPDGEDLFFSWVLNGDTISNSSDFRHIITEPGIYHVVLTILDERGAIKRASSSITVKPPAKQPEISTKPKPIPVEDTGNDGIAGAHDENRDIRALNGEPDDPKIADLEPDDKDSLAPYYLVKIVVNSNLSQAEIWVDGEKALVVKDTPIIKTVRVRQKKVQHKFLIATKTDTCIKELFITADNKKIVCSP